MSCLLRVIGITASSAGLLNPALGRMQQFDVGRRAFLGAAVVMPMAAVQHTRAADIVLTPVMPTPARLLTIGEYLVDIREARRALEQLQPLIELDTNAGKEAVRIGLRKTPVNGIRKACSKVLVQLDGSSLQAAKQAEYDAIKGSIAVLDDGCRPTSTQSSDGLVAELQRLEGLLDQFANGFAS
eukprot:CAMPEP_0119311440 /NCGR_PEP_ID=MMETSP1333-20130426/22424_1 /TAXON_ID=418940 /ORGANISM="Scyphosphaera apsteinii, Strain RCC1455" /LENGTH=183 /DNA_ID=CAMNT_0007315809 /DNA_START=34 /DNA_END=585 /DNA_ORIENTATION=-